jgi:hypothetical protein
MEDNNWYEGIGKEISSLKEKMANRIGGTVCATGLEPVTSCVLSDGITILPSKPQILLYLPLHIIPFIPVHQCRSRNSLYRSFIPIIIDNASQKA